MTLLKVQWLLLLILAPVVLSVDAKTPLLADTTIVIKNGLINREISYNSAAGSLATTYLGYQDDDFNFMEGRNNPEFSVSINGTQYDGRNSWYLQKVYEENAGEGGRKTIFEMSGPDSVEVHIVYSIFNDLPVISKNISFINRGNDSVTIEGLDVEALTLRAFPTSAEYYVNYCRNKHIGPYEGNWDDPVVAMHLPAENRGVILGNEAPGVLKRIAFYHDERDFVAGLTHPDQPYAFRKYLAHGEAFTSPSVFSALYKDAPSPYYALNFVIPEYVRKHMSLELFKSSYRPVFLYNTWNPFRKNINDTLIYELANAAAECGIKEFIIDDGWQTNVFSDETEELPWWYTQVGDYLVDNEKFPGGLKPVFDSIREKKMKPGLWLSIGSASTTSSVYREHPGFFAKDHEGNLANLHEPDNHSMKTACMATGWTDHIKEVIERLSREHGLVYTKLDFATVTSAYVTDPEISGCYATDHPLHRDHEESLLVNYMELFRLFDNLQSDLPDLFIDCTFETQGKLHMIDYAFLKHAEGNWLSNIEEESPAGALRVRHLAWQRTPVIPASSMVIGNLRLDSDDLEFDFFSLLGTFPIMLGDIRGVPDSKRKWLSGWVEWMELMQERYDYLSYRQDLAGFGEPAEYQWDGWQRINTETRDGGIVGVFRQGAPESKRIVAVNGLDPLAGYEVIDPARNLVIGTYSGEELSKTGFKVQMHRLYQGSVFEIRKL